jgi:hypothetical protein
MAHIAFRSRSQKDCSKKQDYRKKELQQLLFKKFKIQVLVNLKTSRQIKLAELIH